MNVAPKLVFFFYQIGMLTLKTNLPEISFQEKSDQSLEKLLNYIQTHLPDDKQGNEESSSQANEAKDLQTSDVSYQVCC